MANPRVGIDLQPDQRASVSPMDYLGGPLFQSYRTACSRHGARYDSELKANLVSAELVPGLADDLRGIGLEPVVSVSLAAWLRARAGQARGELEQAKTLLRDIEANLATRGLRLYPFQVIGAAWMGSRRTGLLCDDMGLGKTIQAAMAINTASPRVVITCPATLKGNWARELALWRPDILPVILSGRGSFCWPQPGQAVILNPELLPKIDEIGEDGQVHKLKPFAGCPAGLDLIADECHAYKSAKALRTKSFRALARAVRAAGGRSWGLTGTPLLSRPDDLFAILAAFDLLKDTFGDWPGFCWAWGAKPAYWGGQEWGEPGPAIGGILKRAMLRRKREEVLPDLPTKTRSIVPVDIDKTTRELCDSAKAAILAAGISLEQMVSEGQISGAAFEAISRVRAALATAKIPAMMSLLDEYEQDGEPVVVFSAHKAPIHALAHRIGWVQFTGETPADERTQIVADFQAGKYRGIGATIQAGGIGITLTKAHHVIFVDQDWTPALNCQAEDRCCRIGQDRGVIIRVLAAPDTVDEDVAIILAAKQRMIDGSVERAASKPAEMPQTVDLEQIDRAARNIGTMKAAPTGRRGPLGAAEQWARGALLGLAERAGFKTRDVGFGSSLASQIRDRGELTDSQWHYAVRLCKSYEGVGPCPV